MRLAPTYIWLLRVTYLGPMCSSNSLLLRFNSETRCTWELKGPYRLYRLSSHRRGHLGTGPRSWSHLQLELELGLWDS